MEVLAMVNHFQEQQTMLRWCNSDQQLADGLTKSSAQDKLRKFLMSGQKWNLHFDEEFVSAKKRRKIEQDKSEDAGFSDLSCGLNFSNVNLFRQRILGYAKLPPFLTMSC